MWSMRSARQKIVDSREAEEGDIVVRVFYTRARMLDIAPGESVHA